MAKKKRPTDVNKLAKSIIDLATGEAQEPAESKKAAAGRAGGLKGGKARAAKLTAEQRKASAKKAVQARWSKKS